MREKIKKQERLLVTLIFLTRNPGEEFKKTLNVVTHQKTPWKFEILDFDNESTDGTWEVLQKYKVESTEYKIKSRNCQEIRMFRVPRQEFMHGKTRNKALELARGKVIVNLVGDSVPVGEKWLATLVAPLVKDIKTLELSDEVVGVSGRQVPPNNLPVAQKFFLLKSYPKDKKILKGDPGTFGPGKIWFTNVCSAINKQYLIEHPFPDIIMSEDQAWAMQALGAGKTIVYEPEAQVIHGHKLNLYWLFKRNSDSGASLSMIGASVPTVGSGKMWRHLVEEISYGIKTRGVLCVPGILVYEVVRWLGFQTGYRKWVPWQVKKYFSIVPWWWEEHFKKS